MTDQAKAALVRADVKISHLRNINRELVEALERCRLELKLAFADEQCDHAVGACYCPVFRALDLADAAIAKAKGDPK